MTTSTTISSRFVAIALVAIFLAGGCTAAVPASPTPSQSPAATRGTPDSLSTFPIPAGLPSPAPDFTVPTADSAFGQELRAIGEDGLIDKDTALRLFALAFGDIPGVQVQRDGKLFRSGSLAIRAVMAHWDELTAEQQQAIDAALALPDDAIVLEIPPVGTTGARPGALAAVGGAISDAPYTTQLREAIRSAAITVRQMIATRMDGDIPGKIDVDITPCGTNLGCTHTLWGSPSAPVEGGTGSYAGCRIDITAQAIAGGAPWIVNTLAHEIFHCFQGSGYGSYARAHGAPAWVIEGGAEWVGNDITGDMTPTDNLMGPWFWGPDISLMKRSYDAAAFWAHLAETGTNPYDVFPFVFLTGDGPSAFKGSGGADNEHFLNSWASSVTLKDEFGRDWETQAPGMPDFPAQPEQWDVANDSSVEIHAAPYTARVFELDVSADVLAISGTGHGRISDGVVDTYFLPASFCTKEDGCPPCPDSNQVPPSPLGTHPWFVLTGGVSGATYTVEGLPLEPCDTPQPTATPSALRAHIERPDMPNYAFMAGTVFDVTTCDGPYGHWSGYMNAGGLATGGQVIVPFKELPVDFGFSGDSGIQEANVTAAGTVVHQLPIPQPIDVSYPLIIQTDGSTMSVTGIAGFVTGQSPLIPITVPLEPAPPGTCDDAGD